jgi:hypothetical protein
MAGERPNFIQAKHTAGYEAAIKRVVPESFLKRAAEVVQSRKPTDPRLRDLDVLGVAKVLVVEDESSWALIHKSSAEDAGHEVVTATSAEEAKKVLEANGIDFIVTDGLHGKWTQVHDLAKEKEIRTVLVSGDDKLGREAKERGVAFVDKLYAHESLDDMYKNI